MAAANLKDGKSKSLVMSEMRVSNVTRTMAGNETFTVDSPTANFLDTDGGKTVTLPAESDSDGLIFLFYNSSGGAEVLTIKDDGGSTVCTPTENESALVFCDGRTWAGLVGASS